MKSVDKFLKNCGSSKNHLVSQKSQQIRYNIESLDVGEDYFWNDLKLRVNIFIIYRNPKNILNKILSSFQGGDFHPILEEDSLIGGSLFEGKVPRTVNSYLFKSYLVSRSTPKFDFGFTHLPVIFDKNLSMNYKKHGNIEDYLRKFID